MSRAHRCLFDMVLSDLLEKNLAHNCFRYRSWFDAFLYLLTGDGGGSLWKHSTCTLQLLLRAPIYQHVVRQFIAKKGSCNRSAGGDMVRIKCWVCHFNGTIMVVLHLRLRPLCKWFSVQLSPRSGAFHFGISLLVAQFMWPAFFLFFESFHSFVFRFTT